MAIVSHVPCDCGDPDCPGLTRTSPNIQPEIRALRFGLICGLLAVAALTLIDIAPDLLEWLA